MVEQFRTYLEQERRYSPLTVRNYMHDVQEFAEWLDQKPFDPRTVKRDDIRNWIVSLGEQTVKKSGKTTKRLSAASINRALSSIKALFKYLYTTELITENPAAAIHTLKTPSRLPSYVPSKRMRQGMEQIDDTQRLSDSFIVHRNALIMVLFYGLGIRLAELNGMNIDDIAEDFSTVKIFGKGNKQRYVPIIEYVADRIRNYLYEIKRENICKTDQKALILSKQGERLSRIEIYRIVKAELTAMGVKGKCSPHVLRHTFATHLINNGADIRQIQELLGHASLKSTQVYTHNSIEQLKAVYDKAHPRGRATAPSSRGGQ